VSSLDDSSLVRRAKSLVPTPAKTAVGAAIRGAGQVSAPLRSGPDVLVVGAKRAGTTFVWSSLLSHPQVMPMVPAAEHLKSTHWFTRHADRPESWFLGHFPLDRSRAAHARRHGAALTVEANPLYLFDPRVVRRASALLPDARVVVLLRDPVERAYSHYRERLKAGVEGLGFAEALAAEDARLAGEQERMAADPTYYARAWDWYGYRRRGEYADQVQAWRQAYGTDQVLVLRSEDLYADPSATLGTIQAFAGLDPHPLGRARRNSVPGSALPPGPAEELRAHFEPHTTELARLLDTEPWW